MTLHNINAIYFYAFTFKIIFYTGILNGKYHLLPLASLLVKLLTNNGIFFPKQASALTVHCCHFYNHPLFGSSEKRVDVFFKSASHLNPGNIFIRFSRLAYTPAEDRRDGPSKPLSSGECCTHNQNTVRWHGLPSL